MFRPLPLATVATLALLAFAGIAANSGAMQAQLLDNLNAERTSRGLAALHLSAELDKAAQGHACDNAKRHSISHVSSDGSHLQNRLRRAGYAYRTAAENTGRGFASGARAVEWWMALPKHKQNMLIGQVRDVGIGIAMSEAPDSRLHWILVVGKSK
jgi:uncharacterized protein YkwD